MWTVNDSTIPGVQLSPKCGSEVLSHISGSIEHVKAGELYVLSQNVELTSFDVIRKLLSIATTYFLPIAREGGGNAGGFDMDCGAAAGPNDMAEAAWLNELDTLFRDTEPQQPPVVNGIDSAGRSHGSVAGDTAAHPKATQTAKKPRISRKEELQYLRMKVKDMQTQLNQLKAKSDEKEKHSARPSAGQETQHFAELWKSLSHRQKTQRDSAEIENAKLREKLKTQVRMAKSLQRILRKRTRDQDQATPKRTKPILRGMSSSASAFDGMLERLDELYVETDYRIALAPTASIAKPTICKRDAKFSAADGMYLEFQDSKLLPFDLSTCNRALWRFLTAPGLKFNHYIDEHVEMQGNTFLRRFGVEFKHGGNAAVMFGRQVARRYVESGRVVLVRHTIVDEIQLAGAPTGGLTFSETGWIVLKPAPESLGTGAATLTQAYATMTPDIDLDAQWEVGALTDFVLRSREDADAGNDAILETLLFEEAGKQARTT